MTTSDETLYSDLAIPPGEGLLEEIEFRGISPRELAASLRLPVEAVNELTGGDRAITPDIAASLESALGVSAQSWLNLEARYRTTLARQWEKTGHGGATGDSSVSVEKRTRRPTERPYNRADHPIS